MVSRVLRYVHVPGFYMFFDQVVLQWFLLSQCLRECYLFTETFFIVEGKKES